jgi:teichuronic acid biosynthesis glycosyltransferase TuaG
MNFSISVVIPFYHAEEFFETALNSVLAQSFKVKEIIVVNDGCGEKAEVFLAQFPEIITINLNENKGPSNARNIGVKAAKSDWIAFLDADDEWLPNKLREQITFLEKNPQFSACHTGIETFNTQGNVSIFVDKPFDTSIEDLLKSSHVTPPSLLIKKEVLETVNYFDINMQCSEDHDFSIRVLMAGFKIGFLNQPLTRVRRMDHGNISSNGRKLIIGHVQLVKKNYRLFKALKGSASFFMYKTFMTAGGKSSGIERKLYYLAGHIIKLLFSVQIK